MLWQFRKVLTVLMAVEASEADEGPGPGSPGTGSNFALTHSGSLAGSSSGSDGTKINLK